ncbi:hypothetical protein [Naasia lichenicola]|uniref:Galactosyltransferase C-terminal domain-containing protein n=1 Tax=Naasia lichenicola TaxID=2565933 RepID=A0A4V3WT91_9MICO|nr:hypothetical protein [Naasia lichenicola]THG31077.1 hypothetical protein E6C64_10855 [Naasia lichenicola]
MLTVVIPWRPAPTRMAAFDEVTSWYREHLPEARIRPIDSDDPIFNLARCRNLGVREAETGSPDDVVILADADTLPEAAPLRAAIAAAMISGRVELPYTEYRWLGAAGTAQFCAGTPLVDCTFELVRGACSGVYVTTPATWWSSGGQDERFRGWGYEDAAWYLAHETVLGEPPRRSEGRVYALHHQAEVRAGVQYDANAALMDAYRAAAVDAASMRSFLGL